MQSLGIEHQEHVDSPDSSSVPYQKWVGKDYYNPFVKDFIDLHKPHEGKTEIRYSMCAYVLQCCPFLFGKGRQTFMQLYASTEAIPHFSSILNIEVSTFSIMNIDSLM